uniref:Odorant binding protein 14 n=1 Tax=Drosicha corpulenta TaxID=535978 RepID=A0A0U3T254_9HEMI|nr:odorant binding protein 14 [Drosicha corpulenta]
MAVDKKTIKVSVMFSILSLILAVSQLTDARYTVDQIRQLAEHCKANKEDLEISLKYEVPETDSGKCLMTCMLKNLDILTADGVFNKAGSLKALQTYWSEIPNNELEKSVETCDAHMNNQPRDCTAGYLAIKCINASFKKLGALKS